MEIHFTGKNIELTDAIKRYITDKLQALSKRDNHITHIHVTLHVEHGKHIAEATLHINGTEIHAKDEEHDMYHAIDALNTKLLAQLTKHKEKFLDNHR